MKHLIYLVLCVCCALPVASAQSGFVGPVPLDASVAPSVAGNFSLFKIIQPSEHGLTAPVYVPFLVRNPGVSTTVAYGAGANYRATNVDTDAFLVTGPGATSLLAGFAPSVGFFGEGPVGTFNAAAASLAVPNPPGSPDLPLIPLNADLFTLFPGGTGVLYMQSIEIDPLFNVSWSEGITYGVSEPAQDTSFTAPGSVAHTVDLNGDGRDDLLLGRPFDAVGGHAAAGVVAIHLATPAGTLSSVPDLILTEPNLGSVVNAGSFLPGTGPQSNHRFGATIASGDLDGDGMPDLVIAATGGKGPRISQAPSGTVYIVSGAAVMARLGGAQPAEIATLTPDEGVVAPILTGNNDPAIGSAFGASLAIADLDGDSHLDLLVGAPFESSSPLTGGVEEGALHGYAGPIAFTVGSLPSEAQMLVEALPSLSIPASAGTAGERLGAAVAIGNLDADSSMELIVSAPGAGLLRSYEWAAGPAALSSTPDLYLPLGGSTQLGFAMVVGDFDGDGIEDVAASAVDAGSGLGEVLVWKNGPGVPSESLRSFSGYVANEPASPAFGRALLAADLNDDGIEDLVIGASDADSTGGLQLAGQVTVHFGSPTEPGLNGIHRRLKLNAGSPISGGAFGYGLAAGRFSGTPVADLIVTSPFDDAALFNDLLHRRENPVGPTGVSLPAPPMP